MYLCPRSCWQGILGLDLSPDNLAPESNLLATDIQIKKSKAFHYMFIESDMNAVRVNAEQQVLSQYLAEFH